MADGFENVPGMLGTRVRPRRRVDGIATGLAEGGKSLMYGYMDAMSGVVTEPMDGYKRSVSWTTTHDNG